MPVEVPRVRDLIAFVMLGLGSLYAGYTAHLYRLMVDDVNGKVPEQDRIRMVGATPAWYSDLLRMHRRVCPTSARRTQLQRATGLSFVLWAVFAILWLG